MAKAEQESGHISRRAFLSSIGAGIALVALKPSSALASVGGSTVADDLTVDELWRRAVENARKDGNPVYYNCDLSAVNIEPYSTKGSCKVEQKTTISGLPEKIYATAYFTMTDDKKKILKLTKMSIYATASNVTDKTKLNVTIADGGRTLIATYDVILQHTTLGISQKYKLYMEFGRNGSGFMKIEYA